MKNKFLLLFFLFTMVLTVGFSSWSLLSESSSQIQEVVPVAYVKNSDSTIGFLTIESALQNAKDDPEPNKVIVYAKTNPTIKRNCTLAKNDTLLIPFDDACIDDPTFDANNKKVQNESTTYANRNGVNSVLADSTLDLVNKFLCTNVTINNNVILSMETGSKLILGGTLGANAQPIMGQTSGNYAQITMNAGSSIINNGGTIDCYGYIKQSSLDNNSSIYVNGGKILSPFVIYDFRGGANTTSCYSALVSPFNVYDTPNIQIKTIFDGFSNFVGYADLFASNSHHFTTVNIYSNTTSSLIQGNNETIFSVYYKPQTLGLSLYKKDYSEINITGGASTNMLSMTAMGETITTENILFPVTFKAQFKIDNGTYNINNRIKVLPGTNIDVGENAILCINYDTIFYQKFVDTVFAYKYNSSTYCDLVNEPANLNVYGTLKINCRFGGKINSKKVGSSLTFTKDFKNGQSSLERQQAGFSSNKKITQTVSEITYGDLSNVDGSMVDNVIFPKESGIDTTYNGVSDGSNFYWSCLHNSSLFYVKLTYGPLEKPKEDAFKIYGPTINDSRDFTYHNCYPLILNNGDFFKITKSDTDTNPEIKFTNPSDGSLTFSYNTQYTANQNFELKITPTADSGCLSENTLISMNDGTVKFVQDLKVGDIVKVFNHETGLIDCSPIIFITHNSEKAVSNDILRLNFDNGIYLDIIYNHALFDKNLNKYVVIDNTNVEDFLGHEFAYYINKDFTTIKLMNYSFMTKVTKKYCPVTAFHMDLFANGLLTMPTFPDDIKGLYNIFDLDNDMKYNAKSKADDIEKYGLFTYDEFIKIIYISKEAFNVSPAIYLKVSLGKGLITEEQIKEGIEFLLSNDLIE